MLIIKIEPFVNGTATLQKRTEADEVWIHVPTPEGGSLSTRWETNLSLQEQESPRQQAKRELYEAGIIEGPDADGRLTGVISRSFSG